MHGRGAPNKIVKVPIGTVVYSADQPVAAVYSSRRSPTKVDDRRTDGEEETNNSVEKSESKDAQDPTGNPPSPGYGAASAQPPTSNEEENSGTTARTVTLEQSAIRNPQSTIGPPLVDLATEGQEFVIAHGGKGGKGNVHFKSS